MKNLILPLLAVLVAPLAGCGSGDVKLVKVSGTVTYNGKPFAGALVEFMPERSNSEATIGSDKTGPEGNYLVVSASGRSGLAPGKYTVRISKAPPETGAGAADAAPTPENDPGQMAAANAAQTKKAAKKDEEISGTFTREVEASGSVLDFDVKASEKAASK